MRVTKWGETGILCAMELARHYGGAALGAAEIAESQGLDLPYTQQILQRLRKGEIIESIRGPHGGYRLSRPPAEISLRDILHAAEGDTFEFICDYAPIRPGDEPGSPCSTKQSCSLHKVWAELRTAIEEILANKLLSDLVADQTASDLVQLASRAAPSEPGS